MGCCTSSTTEVVARDATYNHLALVSRAEKSRKAYRPSWPLIHLHWSVDEDTYHQLCSHSAHCYQQDTFKLPRTVPRNTNPDKPRIMKHWALQRGSGVMDVNFFLSWKSGEIYYSDKRISPNPTHISYVFVCIMRVTPRHQYAVTRILGYIAMGQLNQPLFHSF
jgi:hypothetical protein